MTRVVSYGAGTNSTALLVEFSDVQSDLFGPTPEMPCECVDG